MRKKLFLSVSTIFSVLFFSSLASGEPSKKPLYFTHHPFYMGVLVGYGSTDWSELTANCSGLNPSQCDQVRDAAPVSAGDFGAVWGVTAGYEVQPHFAFEASFINFPETKVKFSDANSYPQFNYTSATMVSHTYAFDVIGKFMVRIMDTGVRAFADAGMAVTHRHDVLANLYRINPTFGIGFDYVFHPHWMLDGEFQYIAGYDQATLTPAIDYSPFLFSIHLVIAYRF